MHAHEHEHFKAAGTAVIAANRWRPHRQSRETLALEADEPRRPHVWVLVAGATGLLQAGPLAAVSVQDEACLATEIRTHAPSPESGNTSEAPAGMDTWRCHLNSTLVNGTLMNRTRKIAK